MERNKLMLLGAALATILVVVGGYFLGVQPQLTAATAAEDQIVSVESQNSQLATAGQTLRSAYSKLDSLKTQLASLQMSLPDDAASADLIREYNAIAVATGTSITRITTSAAEAYTPPVVAPTAAVATGTSTSTASASASATATPTPTASTPTAPVTATNPLITPANFSAIAVTVEISGSYAQALAYLKGLHDGARLFLVTQVSSGVTSGSTDTSDASAAAEAPDDWTITGLVYALADAASANATQQTPTNTAAGATTPTDASSTDTAAGK